jgi:putative membrane protein
MKTIIVTGVLATALALSAGVAVAKDSKEFLKQAIEGHNGEIVLGQLAQLRAGSEPVRQFGRALATDHAAGKEQALALAQKIGLTPPDAPSKDAANERDKLGKLEGAEFDREFVAYMAKDHRHDIREFEEQAKARHDNADIAQYAESTLPKLQQHLEMAQNLEKTVKSEK